MSEYIAPTNWTLDLNNMDEMHLGWVLRALPRVENHQITIDDAKQMIRLQELSSPSQVRMSSELSQAVQATLAAEYRFLTIPVQKLGMRVEYDMFDIAACVDLEDRFQIHPGRAVADYVATAKKSHEILESTEEHRRYEPINWEFLHTISAGDFITHIKAAVVYRKALEYRSRRIQQADEISQIPDEVWDRSYGILYSKEQRVIGYRNLGNIAYDESYTTIRLALPQFADDTIIPYMQVLLETNVARELHQASYLNAQRLDPLEILKSGSPFVDELLIPTQEPLR